MRSDEFIDLYKQLEDELEVKFSTAKQRRYSSVVFEYINHYESAPVRETLNPVSYTHLTLPTKA